jgi:acetyl-CoA carboxylase biotin carboxyl carrier protein
MNLEDIKELIKSVEDSSLTSFELKDKDFRLSLSKGATGVAVPAQVVAQPVQQAVAQEVSQATTPAPATASSNLTINSPMVGTFYKAPSPDASPFVKEGDTVRKGQPLCILEAMKIMNEIDAEFDCKIIKILVDDSQAVEFDMPIFEIEKI